MVGSLWGWISPWDAPTPPVSSPSALNGTTHGFGQSFCLRNRALKAVHVHELIEQKVVQNVSNSDDNNKNGEVEQAQTDNNPKIDLDQKSQHKDEGIDIKTPGGSAVDNTTTNNNDDDDVNTFESQAARAETSQVQSDKSDEHAQSQSREHTNVQLNQSEDLEVLEDRRQNKHQALNSKDTVTQLEQADIKVDSATVSTEDLNQSHQTDDSTINRETSVALSRDEHVYDIDQDSEESVLP